MEATVGLSVIRLLLDCVGVVLVIFVVYIVAYNLKKYMLMKWVSKAVNAAERMFVAPEHTKENSVVKKEWVMTFLKDNGLTSGVSDSVVDTLIEAEVNTLKIQQGSTKLI
jgi:hypothetical protein